jgi:hypothetical protein
MIIDMSAKAFLQKQWDEDPVLRGFKRSNVGWGEHVLYRSPHKPPPLPPTASSDSKMVWNPELQKYVVGLKKFDYVPDLKIWLNKQKTERQKRSSYSPYSPKRTSTRGRSTRGRSTRRKTRYFNEATRTYLSSKSRSPSRRRHTRSKSKSRHH